MRTLHGNQESRPKQEPNFRFFEANLAKGLIATK